jgi:prepilin-type N-terminal cleavage/methylation domain-containing protein
MMSMKKNKKIIDYRKLHSFYNTINHGFTLVELLIYMGIMSVLLGVLSAMFVSIIDVQLESEATSVVEQDTRFILSRFMHDINSSTSIVSPALGQQATSLQIIKDNINYLYSLDADSNLILSYGNESYRMNSQESTISGLTFQQIGNVNEKNTIRVGYTVTSKTKTNKGAETRTIQSTIGIR